MTDDSLILSWSPPEKDGGSKITEYIVEYKETTKTTWTRAGTSTGDCTHIEITKLTKDASYEFKISARNEAGVGPALITEDKIIVGKKISKLVVKFIKITKINKNKNYCFIA